MRDKALSEPILLNTDYLYISGCRLFLSQLYFLYEALEAGLDHHKDHPIVGPVLFGQEVFRLPNIKEDLTFFHGDDWRSHISCLDSTKEYADHISEITQTNPQLLIADAYVRYQGDLSGGQILKRIIRRTYGFDDKTCDGVRFYEFDTLESIPGFKDFYSARMNELKLSADQKKNMVEQAISAFQFNINIFREVVAIAEKDPEGYMKDKKPMEAKQCPIMHNGTHKTTEDTQNTTGKCPVAHAQNGTSTPQGKCPVAHNQNGGTAVQGTCPFSAVGKNSWLMYGGVAIVVLALVFAAFTPRLSAIFT